MTVGQLQTLILSWVDDEKQGYFNQNDVLTWLNLAHRQVQFELLGAGQNWYMKPVETQTVVGQADYTIPSDFIFIHRLEYVLSGTGYSESRQAITPITTNQQDLIPIVLGNPENYYLKKDRFTISPTPNNIWTLRLYYSPMVADLVYQTDVPDCPEQFMEYVAILAAFNCYIKDDRAPDNLIAKKAEYRETLKKMASQRKQDQSRQVVQTSAYDYGTFY